MNRSPAISRWLWGLGLVAVTLGVSIWTGFRLYPGHPAARHLGWGADPTEGTVLRVHTATGRIDLQFTDENSLWDWDWTTPDCIQALVAWVAADEVRSLNLQLADPASHPLGLPIRSLYPEAHVSPGIAGAWCETRGREDRPDLLCSLAPLDGAHPVHVSVAMMGALAQAGAYAFAGEAFLRQAESDWSWAQWRPLVKPGANSAQWQSACPSLLPQSRRFS